MTIAPNWVDSLGAVEAWIDPAIERVYAVLDNLNVHSAPDVLLSGLLHRERVRICAGCPPRAVTVQRWRER